MNKLLLIIKREYLTRVKKKSFILLTLLTPIGFGLLMFLSGYFASGKMSSAKQVLVKDETSVLAEYPIKSDKYNFVMSDKVLDTLKANYAKEGYDLFLHIPKLDDLSRTDIDINFYSNDKLSFTTIESLEDHLSESIKDYKIAHSDLDQAVLKSLDTNVSLENGLANSDSDGGGDKSSKFSSIIATGLSYFMGFMMYMVIFIFGGMVMRSVMEEKINRIVEVMISSVKPFQLLLGKVLGVGLVGLTQLLIWILLIPLIIFIVSSVMGLDTGATMTGESAEMAAKVQSELESGGKLSTLISEFQSQNWLMIIPSFIIYFLGGFFIYASLFAAVGSAIGDDLGEGQQLMFPIVIPVIIALMMLSSVLSDPDGPIAVFGSMFPLFSPIIMPARLPFNPPMWQLILSIVILIASVIFFIWLASRIYRVGIFMYGKKVTFKELGKWLFYKG
jgi:ABC-2 type transport system permease protein